MLELKRYIRNIKIIIDEAGVSTFEAEGHNREEETILALNDMRNNGLVLVKNYEEIFNALFK